MKYALAFAIATVFAASSAVAGEKAADAKGMDHMMMDAKMEAKMDAKMAAHFQEIDANADGKLTETELVDYAKAKAKKEFAAMAGDDGAVTLDEMKVHHQAKHEEMMKDQAAMDHGKMDPDARKEGQN